MFSCKFCEILKNTFFYKTPPVAAPHKQLSVIVQPTPRNRRSHQKCSVRKSVLRNFTKFTAKYLCQSLLFNKAAALRPQASNFIYKGTLAQVCSCEICEISKNILFTDHLRATASEEKPSVSRPKCWRTFVSDYLDLRTKLIHFSKSWLKTFSVFKVFCGPFANTVFGVSPNHCF